MWAVWLLVEGLPGLSLAAEAGKSDREAMAVSAQGYLSNRESFSTIRCRFRSIRAKANSVEDAVKGVLVGDQRVYEGLWLVNGAKVRQDMVCKQEPRTLEEAAAKAGVATGGGKEKRQGLEASGRPIWVPCTSRHVLRDGSYTLSYSPLIGAANLYPSDMEDPMGVQGTPIDMDVMANDESLNPAALLQDVLSGRFSGRFDGTERVLGVDTLAFTVLGKSGNPAYRFLLDPRRGYLPINMWGARPDGRKGYDAFMTRVRACSRDRWFPERSVVIRDIGVKPPITVDVIELVELDVDNPPPDEEFALSLRAHTQVSVQGRMEWVTLEDDERIAAGDLPRLHQRCIERGKTHAADAERAKPAEPQPKPDNRLRWIVTTVAGCVLAVAVVWSVFRWRRRKAR